jgi:hypothetical protein
VVAGPGRQGVRLSEVEVDRALKTLGIVGLFTPPTSSRENVTERVKKRLCQISYRELWGPKVQRSPLRRGLWWG